MNRINSGQTTVLMRQSQNRVLPLLSLVPLLLLKERVNSND